MVYQGRCAAGHTELVPAYVIIDLDVHEAESYRQSGYSDAVRALVDEHGGRYLAAGGTHVVLEGDWHPTRLGIIEFPTMEALRAFTDSDAYRPWRELRQTMVHSTVVAVDGVADDLTQAGRS